MNNGNDLLTNKADKTLIKTRMHIFQALQRQL